MSSFSFSTVIHGKNRDFTIKTMNFESIQRIIVNLSDRDRVLHTNEVAYDGKLSDPDLMALVKRQHDDRVSAIQEIIKISTKLEKNPEAESNHKLGVVFLNLGLGQEAATEFERSLALDANNAPILNRLGLAYILENRYADAERVVRKAVGLKPDYPDLHNNLGQALLLQNNFPDAEKEFQEAIRLNPKYGEAHFNLGLGLLSEAAIAGTITPEAKAKIQEQIKQAVDLNSDYNNGYLKVADNYLGKDQLLEARQALQEAKTSASSQPGGEVFHEFYLRLKYGDEGVDRQTTEQYIVKLEELLERSPHYVDVHNDLGIAYLIQCRFLFNRAINEFRRALAANPNYAKAQKNLKLAENEGKGFLILLRAILYF